MGLPPGGVWLDARGTQSAAHGERGIARYIAEQAKALLELAPEAVGAVGFDPEAPVPPSLAGLGERGLIASYAEPPSPVPAIHHVMSPFEPTLGAERIWPQWARGEGTHTVVTLYDLIPLIFRDEYLSGSWSFWGTVWTARLGLIRAADQVLTISERTAADASEHLGIPPERITVIDSGVSDQLSALAPTRERAEEIVRGVSRRLRRGYLLYVGGDDPRKNLEGMVRAYALLSPELRRAHQLVIVCRLTLARRVQLMALARRLGISPRDILLTGFVSDEQLAALYRACGLFVFPSLYEGAGLPILEAMSCDAPVAASFTSAIPEILGDSQATFDPSDPHDIARALAEVLPGERALDALRERSRRRVRLFTWKRVAERTLAGYERALTAPRGRRRRPRTPAPVPGARLEPGEPRPTRSLPPAGVWLDAQGTQSVAHGERGIARYIAEQTQALLRTGPGALGRVRLDPALPVPPSIEDLRGSGLLGSTEESPNGKLPPPAIHHVMSPFELAIGLDEMWPRWARRHETRTVVTLYDLIPLLFRERYLDPQPQLSAQYFARLGLIRDADQVLTISEQTAADAIEHLGLPEEKVTVIGCGVSGKLAGLVGGREEALGVLRAEHPEIREGFLLYVGGDDPRKNLDGVIRAFALLPEELRRAHQLVIVCALRPERIAELRAFAEELGIAPGDVVFTGYLPDRSLAALYRTCGLFVFPSLYEGAGLPILEAMSCGAPVAASDSSSIPEILGDLEATFDPARPERIASTLEGVLTSPERLEALRERSRERVEHFSWDRVAELTFEGYERALAEPRARRPRRRRLAVLTPWPPQATGVATHSRRLIEELSAHAELDVIAPACDGIAYDRSLEPRVRLLGDPDFPWAEAARDYDRLLYALGSSPFHTSAFELLIETPGTVLVHDVRLVGLYVPLFNDRRRTDPAWLERKVVEMYGDRMSSADLRRVWDPEVYVRNGIFMTQEVQERAEEILVHSRYASDVLRTEAPEEPPPTHVVPHGVPVPPPSSGEWAGGGGPLLVSYGGISLATKRTELMLEAFAALRRRRPGARLVLVGSVHPPERGAIERLAGKLGVAGAIELHGRADERSYWGILQAADLAVQLRTGAGGGEASGAVCDCIAARVPTIVSAVGWFGELAEPVVLPVPEDCGAERLAEEMEGMLGDDGRRAEIRAAQDEYARANSFARVAERYAELLSL